MIPQNMHLKYPIVRYTDSSAGSRNLITTIMSDDKLRAHNMVIIELVDYSMLSKGSSISPPK